MLFDGPNLRPAFSNSGGKKPQPEEPPGLLDPLKAAFVKWRGPVVCDQLKTAFDNVRQQNTSEDGRAKDVQAYRALQQIEATVSTMRETIQKGGAEAYAKMQEARTFLGRLQKLGLEA